MRKLLLLLLMSVFAEGWLAAQSSLSAVLPVPPGQYSGISWIAGNRYAVVHDKAAGGGIWFFSLPYLADGTLGKVLAAPAAGTSTASEQRDPEGIAYVPTTGTFFVSGEADQQILEYGFDGLPTGRALAVPPDFGTDRIRPNRGFEALDYCRETELFWATTEAALLADEAEAGGAMTLRLQSFALEDLQPRRRCTYRTEVPRTEAVAAASAEAYAFGVPALAALPDGRLLVLEREIFVPRGGLMEKLRGAFTQLRIFRVDPQQEDVEALEKEEIISFSTTALDLANFEGMCLGPQLPDGRRLLLLIADSQSGRGGLLHEWLRIFIL